MNIVDVVAGDNKCAKNTITLQSSSKIEIVENSPLLSEGSSSDDSFLKNPFTVTVIAP